MGGASPRASVALLVACAAGGVWGIVVLAGGCSSADSNPALLQDCVLPACREPRPPTTAPLSINVPIPFEDAGVVDAGVIPPDGSGIPAAGPGPGIVGNETTIGNAGPNSSNELGPVCPFTAPTNGSPCAPVVNTVACIYSFETCFCTTSWTCF